MKPPGRRPASWSPRRLWAGVGILLILPALVTLALHLGSGTEMVRLRNALAMGPDLRVQDDWRPPAVPQGYRVERVAPDPYFAQVAQRLDLAGLPDDWSRGLAIAQHLLGSAPALNGGAIGHDLRSTHEAIVGRGDGYCGDFVRVFTAIANAAGMTVRSWAFSFDGFGGHGHIWVELWNRDRLRWELIDVYQNYYYVDGSDQPLSALELRAALAAGSPTLRLRALHPGVPPGWAVEAKAWDYLRRGLAEWYMPWGNAVFTADASWPTRAFAGISRAVEGAGLFVAGQLPQVRVLATDDNARQRVALSNLRLTLQVTGALAVLGAAALAVALLIRPRPLRRDGDQRWPALCVVGPLPPPSGGMANQCEQLVRLLRQEGATVTLVRTNAPYRPAWVGRLPVVRAGARLLPYLLELWRALGRAQVVHVFANSGWAWHLLALPALLIARWRGVPAIVNYRGGLADEFLTRAPRHVHRMLRRAAMRVTPSAFLLRVFARHGLQAEVIPNIIDLTRFRPTPRHGATAAPRLLVSRNLEPIYDIPTALRAFARVAQRYPGARLTVAGTGPERQALGELAVQLDIADAVTFPGRVDNAAMAELYAQADLMLNPSTADNMPISILEALASGVPVVSTDAGGIPDLVAHEQTALLVRVGDAEAMAEQALRVLEDPALAARLRAAGVTEVERFSWVRVREQWFAAYWRAVDGLAAHSPDRLSASLRKNV